MPETGPRPIDAQFDTRYFEQLVSARDHWWVEGMRGIGEAILDEHRTGLAVLDAGCGAGALLGWLEEFADPLPVMGIDPARAGLAHAMQVERGVALAQATLTSLPFAGGRFDVIVTTDVLQHLDRVEEAAALAEIVRVLRPGGRVLVRTNSRSGRAHVEERPDWRLYTSTALRESLETAGLVVDAVTPVNFLQGLWASLRPGRQHGRGHERAGDDVEVRPEWGTGGLGIPEPTSRWRNRLLLAPLRAEARWLRGGRRRLPFGHSLYAVARRP